MLKCSSQFIPCLGYPLASILPSTGHLQLSYGLSTIFGTARLCGICKDNAQKLSSFFFEPE